MSRDLSIMWKEAQMTETQIVEPRVTEWLQVKAFQKRHPETGSANFIYQMAKAGKLLSIKLGGRVLIRADALDRLYEEQQHSVGSGKNTTHQPTTPTQISGVDALQ